jgi:hypothetical protein
MSEYRISYNPYTKDYISGCQSHSIQLYNQGKQAYFDDYIRGIILDNVLYLRVFYPFKDIDTLTSDKLFSASLKLLKANQKTIRHKIKQDYNIPINKIVYNATNDLLSGLKLTCI